MVFFFWSKLPFRWIVLLYFFTLISYSSPAVNERYVISVSDSHPIYTPIYSILSSTLDGRNNLTLALITLQSSASIWIGADPLSSLSWNYSVPERIDFLGSRFVYPQPLSQLLGWAELRCPGVVIPSYYDNSKPSSAIDYSMMIPVPPTSSPISNFFDVLSDQSSFSNMQSDVLQWILVLEDQRNCPSTGNCIEPSFRRDLQLSSCTLFMNGLNRCPNPSICSYLGHAAPLQQGNALLSLNSQLRAGDPFSCDPPSVSRALDLLIFRALSINGNSLADINSAYWLTLARWLDPTISQCVFILDALTTEKVVTANVTDRRCYAQLGSLEYAADPCCNLTLLQDTCCVDTLFPLQYDAPNSQPSDVIYSICRKDSKLLDRMNDYFSAAVLAQSPSAGCNSNAELLVSGTLTSEPLSFVSQCSELLTLRSSCFNATDCPFEQDCILGECSPTSDRSTLACWLQYMPSDMQTILSNFWYLTAVNLSLDTMQAKLFTPNCIGPAATDVIGDPDPSMIFGYEYRYMTEASCLALNANIPNNTCVFSYQNLSIPVSVPSPAVALLLDTPALCAAWSGAWDPTRLPHLAISCFISGSVPPAGATCSINSLSRLTLDPSTLIFDPACPPTQCYDSNLLDSYSCAAQCDPLSDIHRQWTSDGRCLITGYTQTECYQNGYLLLPTQVGVVPMYNDPASCAQGIVYSNQVSPPVLTTSTSSGLSPFCTEPCSACVADSVYGDDLCLISAPDLFSCECQQAGGQWLSQNSSCLLTGISSASECSITALLLFDPLSFTPITVTTTATTANITFNATTPLSNVSNITTTPLSNVSTTSPISPSTTPLPTSTTPVPSTTPMTLTTAASTSVMSSTSTMISTNATNSTDPSNATDPSNTTATITMTTTMSTTTTTLHVMRPLTTQFLSCDALSSDTCQICHDSPSTCHFPSFFTCRFDVHVPCTHCQGICSSSAYQRTTSPLCDSPLHTPSACLALCLGDHLIDPLSLASYCPAGEVITPLGCDDPGILDPEMCADLGRRWYPLPSDMRSCLQNTVCILPSDQLTTSITSFVPLPRYVPATSPSCFCPMANLTTAWTWTPPENPAPLHKTPLIWYSNTSVPLNHWGPALDWNLVQQSFSQAAYARFRFIKQSQAICLLNPYLSILETVSCNCTDSRSTPFCKQLDILASSPPLGRSLFCPGEPLQVRMGSFVFSTHSLSIPLSTGCLQLDTRKVAASNFISPPQLPLTTLSFSVPIKKHLNSYSILSNSENYPVGQLVSDGVDYRATFLGNFKSIMLPSLRSEPQAVSPAFFHFLLCIDLRTQIPWDKAFTVPDIGLLNADQSFSILDLPVTVLQEPLRYCFNSSEQGIYFAIRRSPTYLSDHYELSSSQQGVLYFFAVLYLLCSTYCFLLLCITVFILGLWKMLAAIARVEAPPIYVMLLLLVFSLMRGAYLLWVAINFRASASTSVVEVIAAELPIYIFFSLYLVLIFYWAQVYHTKHHMSNALRKMRIPFYLVNAAMYLFFILTLSLYYSSTNKSTISRIYNTVLSAVAFTLITFCTLYGGLLVYRMRQLPGGSPVSNQTLLVTIVVTLGTVTQMLFLLLKTWAVLTDFIIIILYFLFVELIPAYLILYEDLRHYSQKREIFSCKSKPSTDHPSSKKSSYSANPLGSRETLSDSLDSDL